MGFSGHLVFARSNRPLMEAPVFDGVDQEQKDAVHTWRPREGGWQTLQFGNEIWEDDDLPALVEWTGAPACVAQVSESSLALVTGLGTDGRRWQAWLNLHVAAPFLTEEPEDVDEVIYWVDTPEFHDAVGRTRAELDAQVPSDAAGALAWAAAAGFAAAASQSRIEELLRSEETFVEELFDDLLDALGSPAATPTAPPP
ncbi:hypothetical protein [Actinacidiphila glaucinigra]|uniref:hypothetical protein n=1 Tax=Actinacidiphila glaucinigra TaxID=235986 RepID=UPI0036EA839C